MHWRVLAAAALVERWVCCSTGEVIKAALHGHC
jgi:hypothetical protein